jgi:hypothetical protein
MPVPAIPEAPVPITIPDSLQLDHARALLLMCELNRKRAGKDNPLGLVDFTTWVNAFYERFGLNGWSHCSDLIYKFQLVHGAPRLPEGNSFRPAPALAIEPEIVHRALNAIEETLRMVLTPVPACFSADYVERPKLVMEEGSIIQTPAGPARLTREAQGAFVAVLVNPPAEPKKPANDAGAGLGMSADTKKGEDRREDADPKRGSQADPKATRGA